MTLALLAAPLLAALGCLALPRAAAWANSLGALATLGLGVAVAAGTFGRPARYEAGGFFYLDALSGLIVLVVALVGAAAARLSPAYLAREVAHGAIPPSQPRWYYVWLQLSLFAMLAVPLLDNLGLMWVAVEATTVTTALLVGFYRRGHALEAAWKYLVLCTAGIAIALFGVLLTYYAAVHVLPDEAAALSWAALRANAAHLDPELMKLAFALVLVGYGTKAGLAPMHTWLPDAHGQAPAPVSALLSGALLNCALYAVLRYHLLAVGAVGGTYSADLLLLFGTLSIAVAVPFVLVQHDLKRLLAYSSVEHIGIVALGVGIGGRLGLFAAAFHLFNHAVAKSMLFLAAGAIGQRYGTLRLARLRGVAEAMPLEGMVLLAGTLAIAGSPPFAPFASELGIALAGFAGRPAAVAASVVLVAGTVLIFGGMLYHVIQVTLRAAPANLAPATPLPFGWAFLALPLAALLVGGIWLPPFLTDAFTAVGAVLEGSTP